MKMLQAHHISLGLAEWIGTPQIKTLTLLQRTEVIKQLELVREFQHITKAAGLVQVTGTGVLNGLKAGPQLIEAMLSPRDITVCCEKLPCLPEKPLCLVKCADRSSAHVGEVVTFSLRYSNVGGRAITNVGVSDSLSGRLEYIAGSAESDRDAVFTMQENEAGSVLLHWEISGTLLPNQSGRLRFKAKVR
jgi:uncharacterized repeat protein (TIGR01451 family)